MCWKPRTGRSSQLYFQSLTSSPDILLGTPNLSGNSNSNDQEQQIELKKHLPTRSLVYYKWV